MNFLSTRKMVFGLAMGAVALGAFAGLAFWSAQRALRRASLEVAGANNLAFTMRRLDRTIPAGVQSVSATAAFRDAAFFHDRLYISGPTGLWKYAPDGKLLARYRVGLELPSAPLAGLATGLTADATEPELYIATAGAGLLAFSDKATRQLLPEKDAFRELTAVLPLSTGRLLLGTKKNGVLVYDGKRLAPFHPLLSRAQVTALAEDGANLWVGTINQGALHAHAGQVDQLGEAEGLPDPRVLSMVVEGGRAFVGTPLGVAEFRDGRFARVLASGFFANSLLVRGQSLLVGTMDEGVIEVPLDSRGARTPREAGPAIAGPVERLVADGERVYALTDGGFFRLGARGVDWQELIGNESSLLSDHDISALGFDGAARLWVGYFDRGLDILDANLARASHVEDDHVFCVNRLVYDRGQGRMLVATANGLVLFDGEGRERQVLGRAEGLIADHVSDVALTPDGITLATPAGLTILSGSGARSVYAFEGLVNNHVYALAAAGSRLLAGTLGGLSILDDGRVLANFTTANSGLRHNWITAIVPVGDAWFVGTYGAGVLRLDASGHWQTFEDAAGAFNVNNNAMVATAGRVYAGTPGRGLYVYDRAAGRWTVVTAGLPSLNATAVAVRDGYLYVGTDNGLIRIAEADLRIP